ncbi:MAG: oligosaccharide flippase family protein [Acidobacteria bacterium]|nr:oligosaccharide flippase family protein [Acidobacteriota bacterium]
MASQSGNSASPAPDRTVWHDDGRQFGVLAQNMAGRYLAIAADILIGLLLLPYNVAHLGKSEYGLWMLVASVTTYASLLELGYGGALTKYVAKYRALRDPLALNQIVSTTLALYTGIGLVVYGAVTAIAFNLDHLFNVSAAQAATGRTVLLILGAYVGATFAFRPFGTIPAGFQRTHWSSFVSIGTSSAVALVNVLVLAAGYGLVPLVAAVTVVRFVGLFAYRAVAYRTFPGLQVRPSHVRLDRLKELTGFSVYMLLLDIGWKVSFSSPPVVIGAILGSVAVASWTVAERLAQAALRMTNQMNDALFAVIVDSDARRADRLRTILVQGTRMSLASVIPVGGGMALLAHPVVMAFVGPEFADAVSAVQALALMVIVRGGFATSLTMLKGAGGHRAATVGSLIQAAATVGLGVLLVSPFGATGAAIGLAVPVAAVHVLLFVPAACRLAGVRPEAVLWEGVWPALWPAGVAAAAFFGLRGWLGGGLWLGLFQLAGAVLVYLACFGVAIGSRDRRFYTAKLRELVHWRSGVGVPA